MAFVGESGVSHGSIGLGRITVTDVFDDASVWHMRCGRGRLLRCAATPANGEMRPHFNDRLLPAISIRSPRTLIRC